MISRTTSQAPLRARAAGANPAIHGKVGYLPHCCTVPAVENLFSGVFFYPDMDPPLMLARPLPRLCQHTGLPQQCAHGLTVQTSPSPAGSCSQGSLSFYSHCQASFRASSGPSAPCHAIRNRGHRGHRRSAFQSVAVPARADRSLVTLISGFQANGFRSSLLGFEKNGCMLCFSSRFIAVCTAARAIYKQQLLVHVL